MNKPLPDKAAVLEALGVLLEPTAVVELRAISKGSKKRIDAGYFDFDHWPDLAAHACRLSAEGAAVYITLNPVDPQLLSRYNNRMESWAQGTTTDPQVRRRRWLLVDVDPVRPSNTSSTESQLAAASSKAAAIEEYLQGEGWTPAIIAESGNGMHLLYAIDLPNTEESTVLVKAVLHALATRFDDPATKVDRTVFNPARICKLYGTVANKGDHTAVSPWRLSKLLRSKPRDEVTQAQLQRVGQTDSLYQPVPNSQSNHSTDFAGVEEFLTRHGLTYTVDQHGTRERFKLTACPFNPEHVNGEAAIFRKPTGELGFKCQHDSCATKGWRNVRELLDGPQQKWAKDVFENLLSGRVIGAASALQDGHWAWPEPTPLPNPLPSVAQFDERLLPDGLRTWVMDIAHRMQCPPDYTAVAAVAAASSLIGARAVVQPKARDDWRVVPNLWGLVIGRAGVKKSPAINEVLKFLYRLQATEFELWQPKHSEWALDVKLNELKDSENERKAKKLVGNDPAAARKLMAASDTQEEPIVRRYIVNDATVEKLGELLQQNNWGTLSYRDELYGLLTSLDKQGQEGSRGFYLQAYDGNQGYTFDRILRGTVHIPRVCLAMIGSIQPGRIQGYVRDAVSGGSGDDGLLQRFGLAVWPDVEGDFIHVDQWPDTPAKQMAWEIFQRLAALQPASQTEPVVWRFSATAQCLFVEWLVPFENEIRGEELHPAMVSHLAKYRKLIPALALIFALIDTPNSAGVIHERELIRALSWAEYLRTHANRLYSAAVMPATQDAASLLSKIKAGKLLDPDGVILESFTPRHVSQKGWSGLGTTDAVRKGAEILVDFGWLCLAPGQPGSIGGRPSERFLIHPAALNWGL